MKNQQKMPVVCFLSSQELGEMSDKKTVEELKFYFFLPLRVGRLGEILQLSRPGDK